MDYTPADALRLFLIAKEDERGVRPATLTYYEYHIRRFITGTPQPEYVSGYTVAHLREWTHALRFSNLAPRSVRSYQGAVWTWLRWLYHQEDFGIADITRKVAMMTVRPEDYRHRRTATVTMKRDLVRVARTRAEHPRRDAAIIEVLWATGARRSELAACQYADYDASDGTLRLDHTKMGEPRTVHVGRTARNALENYIIKERGREPGALFEGRLHRPLTSDGIRQMIGRLAESTGVAVSAHDFRRAAAARMLETEVPMDVVMHQLGHRSATMSILYGEKGREKRSLSILRKLDEAG